VTGGGSGIGQATCYRLAAEGVSVVVADINLKAAESTSNQINQKYPAQSIAVSCDVSKTSDYHATYSKAMNHFGRLDIIFLNAGIAGRAAYAFQNNEETPEEWRKIIDVNLNAVIDGTQIGIEYFRKYNQRNNKDNPAAIKRNYGRQQADNKVGSINPGVIIATASVAGTIPQYDSPVYAASKAGVVNFVKSLKDLKEEGIRVNAVAPHFTATGMVPKWAEKELLETVIKGQTGILKPDDIADAVLDLILDTDKAGAILRVIIGRGKEYWPRTRL